MLLAKTNELFFCSARQSRYYLGTEDLPPKTSALRKDRDGSHLNDDAYGDTDVKTPAGPYDPNAQSLPSKVDSFIEYINFTYMEGALDTSGKDLLKKDMNSGAVDNPRAPPQKRKIYNGDDVRGTTPMSRRTFVVED